MKIDSPNAIGTSTGFGIPTGGTTNQVLSKVNSTNLNTQWVDNGVPNWTSGGTIQSVGISGTTSAPTFPTSTNKNAILYKQIGAKTWQVSGLAQWNASTGAVNGNGDYLLTLPLGLQFDTTLPIQQVITGFTNTSTAEWLRYYIPQSQVFQYDATTPSYGYNGGIVVWDNTKYRVICGISNQLRAWGSGYYQVGNNVSTTINWSFTFQTL
jgi:hypothetical protein